MGVLGSGGTPALNGNGSGGALGSVGAGSGGMHAAGSGGATGSGMQTTPGTGGMGMMANMMASGGTGGTPQGSGGAGGAGGASSGDGGSPMPGADGDCGSIPATDDYAVSGPFGDGMMMDGSGPDGMYTIIKPAMLGMNGFKHPLITWGNGITTTPQQYPGLLQGIASHGFVIIASDSSSVTSQMMLATVGYSLGGGAAVDSGSHDNVRATVSFHGLQGQAGAVKGPLLLFTTTADGFVTKDSYVKPCYDASTTQPTIMATMHIMGYDSPNGGTASNADFSGHLYPIGDAGDERAPGIAWLRLWIYGDQGAKKYFYGDDCILCKDPWIDIQRKNAMW
jgi:hypothetical protein